MAEIKASSSEEVEVVTANNKHRNAFERFIFRFISDDPEGVLKDAIFEVFIPGVFDSLSAAAQTALQNTFNPNGSHTIVRRGSRITSGGYHDRYIGQPSRVVQRTSRTSTNYDDIYNIEFESKERAEEVLEELKTLVSLYGVASVADVYTRCYDEIGRTSKYPDFGWGWYNLNKARIRLLSNNVYTIDFPTIERVTIGGMN